MRSPASSPNPTGSPASSPDRGTRIRILLCGSSLFCLARLQSLAEARGTSTADDRGPSAYVSVRAPPRLLLWTCYRHHDANQNHLSIYDEDARHQQAYSYVSYSDGPGAVAKAEFPRPRKRGEAHVDIKIHPLSTANTSSEHAQVDKLLTIRLESDILASVGIKRRRRRNSELKYNSLPDVWYTALAIA